MHIAMLLTDPSPILRRLVLKELLGYAEDNPEVAELEKLMPEDPLVQPLFAGQEKDGSWKSMAGVSTGKTDAIMLTSHALKRLGFLGYNSNHPVVAKGAAYLFSRQKKDGSWPLTRYGQGADGSEEAEGYTMIPLQTALPLCALASCGVAADSRAEAAYRWLMEQKLPDGTWPTGKAGGVYAGVGGYRRMPHSRWGCRTNSTEVLWCLALHPVRRKSEAAARLLDLLLSRETKERFTLGFETARLAGLEPHTGYLTYHARFDPGLLLEFCWRTGAGLSDPRVQALAAFIKKQQGAYGLWEYKPNLLASRWVTFKLLSSLVKTGEKAEWITAVPRIHFQSYPPRKKRY